MLCVTNKTTSSVMSHSRHCNFCMESAGGDTESRSDEVKHSKCCHSVSPDDDDDNDDEDDYDDDDDDDIKISTKLLWQR